MAGLDIGSSCSKTQVPNSVIVNSTQVNAGVEKSDNPDVLAPDAAIGAAINKGSPQMPSHGLIDLDDVYHIGTGSIVTGGTNFGGRQALDRVVSCPAFMSFLVFGAQSAKDKCRLPL